ncbi:MAG TPA: hypothetical protein VFQ05_16810, partial [Candidatus Eisenbacteria bacterium]|nr:hypothetical protein [Candidatus Eisenbacteria bacterium]
MVLVSTATVVAHIVGAWWFPSTFWGAHFYRFLPSFVLPGALVLLLIATATIFTARASLIERVRGSSISRIAIWSTVAFSMTLFWLLRLRHGLLGDSAPLSANLPLGEAWHPRQPLTAFLHQAAFTFAERLFPEGAALREFAFDTVAVESVLLGGCFVLGAFPLAKELLRNHDEGLATGPPPVGLAVALLLTQGFIQLCCGYVENYTHFFVALLFYTLLGLRAAKGRIPLIVPSCILAVAIALNLAGAILVPSWIVLLVSARRAARPLAAMVDRVASAAILVLAFVMIVVLAPQSHGGLDYMVNLVLKGAQGSTSLSDLFSVRHLMDVLNVHLLMGPFAALLMVPLLAVIAPRGIDRGGAFLFAAALPALWTSWSFADPLQGFPRDWDIFASFGPLYTATGIYIVSTVIAGTRLSRLFALAVVVSLFHTVPWIALNTSETLALERYKTFKLTRGRAEAVVGQWYLAHADTTQAREWLGKAIQANPGNNMARYHLGIIARQEARYAEAVDHFGIAYKVRPDREDYRLALIDALVLAGEDG